MSVKLTRLNNYSGSYIYTTPSGVQYEVVNFHKEMPECENVWQVKNWETNEGVWVSDTVREAREFLAGLS